MFYTGVKKTLESCGYLNLIYLDIKSCVVKYFLSNFAEKIMEIQVKFNVGWLCLTSHRQRGHLETAPPFTVPCEGREAR